MFIHQEKTMRSIKPLLLVLTLASAPAAADVPFQTSQAMYPFGWYPSQPMPQSTPQAMPMPFPLFLPQQAPPPPAAPDLRAALLAGLANPQALDGILRLAPLLANPPAIEGMLKLAAVAADPRTVDAFIRLAATLADAQTVETLARVLAALSNPKFAEALITLTDPRVLAAAVSAASVLGGAVAGAPVR